MASTYSPNLRLELIGTGEQQGTWGVTTNTNLGTLLEEAIGGYTSVTVTDGADTTLSTNNGSADQSRNMTINLTGALTAARNVICPAIEKVYIVKNATTGGYAVTFKVSGQTGVSIPNGSTYILYVNGTDAVLATGTIAAQNSNNVSITGGSITGITDLAVADGGTGASTAAAAATNLGLGTTDSPQFAAVNIGNATDTTITRSSAGVIAVEGGIVPLQNRTNTFTANQIVEVTDNTNAALRITQLGTGNALLVEDTTNPDATPLVVNNDGLIVSGYTATATIASAAYRAYLLGSGSYYPLAVGYTGASALGAVVSFAKSRGADWATRGIVSNGDVIGGFYFAADDGSTLNSIGAVIQASVDGTPGVGDMPGRLAFFTTADGASSSTERMRIRSDGGIGIGGTGSAAISLSLQKSITGGTTAIGVDISATVLSDVTTGGLGYNTSLSTQAASFSTVLQHYRSTQGTLGAGSTVSLQIGFSSTASLIGATDNQAFRAADTAAVTSGKTAYGFYSAVNTATGGGTTWGFYAAGTAANYFAGQVQLGSGSAGTPSLSAFGDTNTGMWYPAADTIAWATGGSERMRINSSGNVGIGTTSPSNGKLEVTAGTSATGNSLFLSNFDGTYNPYLQVQHSSAGVKIFNSSSYGGPSNNLIFGNGSTSETMRIDASGNLGLGVTPSAWGSIGSSRAIQLAKGALSSLSGGPNDHIAVSTNSFADTSSDPAFAVWKYVANGYASLYEGGRDGTHRWFTAPNGTAGNAITFTERMRIDASGGVGIGTSNTDPTANRVNGTYITANGRLFARANGSWDMGRDVTSGIHISFYTDNGSARVTAGNISSNGSTTSYNTTSDYRLKENVNPVVGSVQLVSQLKPVTFDWKAGFGGTMSSAMGFIAHELQDVFPDAVTGDKDAVDENNNPVFQSVDQSKLVPLLTAALQEALTKINALEARIAALEAK